MKDILYFDMEWVPLAPDLNKLSETHPEHFQAWQRRCEKWKKQDKYTDLTNEEIFDKHGGFFPEFIQIICISAGYWKTKNDKTVFAKDSFYGDDEKEVLENFANLLSKTAGKYSLCGHSIKRFDMPYLAKRMAVHGIKIPWDLNNGKKKPWEIDAIDIAEEWGFGCNAEKFTPLDWICVSLGVPTPKNDISGDKVKDAYWVEDRLEEIKDYCEADIKATALVHKKILSVTEGNFDI